MSGKITGSQARHLLAKHSQKSKGGGTFNSTAFRDKPQRDNPSITNTYFNSGAVDGANHGHVKHRNNPDGTTDYFYVRDVEGNEYNT